MFNKDDEDEEKRKKEADFIINSINPNQEENISNSINSINYANSNNINLNLQNDTDKLFVDRVNEANSIIDSINPRKNIELPKPSNQELQKSKENTQKFLDLIDDKKQENTENDEQTQNIDNNIINSTNYNQASPQQRIAVDVLLNKRTMDEAEKNVEYSNIKVEQPKEKGNILTNIKSFFDNLFLGGSSGIKQTLKYIENSNEQNFANYKNIRENQYMTSPNVSLEDKATQNLSNNMLLTANEDKFIQLADKNIKDYGTLENPLYNTENKENNLVKKGIQDSVDNDTSKIQENINNTNGKISRKLVELAPSIGQMTVGWGISAINPVLGISYFMTSSGGSYIDDAKNRGMNDKEAFNYGTIMGAMEGITEEIGVSKLVKGGKAVSKGFIKEALKNYALNATDNFIQEAIIEPISETTATIVGGKETADWDNITGRMLSAGIDGALTALIMDGASAGINSSIRIVDKIKNNENVSQTEIKNAIKDINDNENIDVENTIQDEINYRIQKASDVNDYIVSKYNDESDNLELYEVKGEAVDFDNNKLNIAPAVVNIDGFYNVIDSNSGLELYTTKNSNKKEVVAEFKRQINSLDNASIKNINTKVAQTKLEVMNRFQKMQENPQTIQDFNIQQNENLHNTDSLNKVSQDNINQTANPKAKDLRVAIEQIQDNTYYNTEKTNEIMKTMSDNFDNVTYTPKGKGSIFAIKNNKGQTVYSKEIRNNIGYSGKNIKNILSNVYNSVMKNDDTNVNSNQRASEPNASDFYTNETNYAVKDIKKVTEPFNKQKNYSKERLAEIWNNEVFGHNYDTYFDKDGNIERYIAIEEDGDNLVVNQYDNNDNILKSEVIPAENGRYSAKVVKDTIERVSNLYDENRPIKGQKDIEGNKVLSMKKKIENEKDTKITNKIKEYIIKNPDLETDINVSTEIIEDINIDKIKQMEAYKIARDLFSEIHKRKFYNNNTNTNIYVTNSDIKESLNTTYTYTEQRKYLKENIVIYSQLDKIIENAKLISNTSELKGRKQYQQWEYYALPINIDNNKFIIQFDTVKREDGETHFRVERLYKIINEGNSTTVVPTKKLATRFTVELPSDTNSISQNTKSVKNNTATKQFMQNDENNTFIEKSLQKFEKAKDRIDRNTIINIANSLNIYHKNTQTFVDENMTTLAGKSLSIKFTEVDNNFFKNYKDKKELRQMAGNFALNNYKNKTVTIRDSKIDIDLSQKGLKKTFNIKQPVETLQTAPVLPDIIQESVYLNSSIDLDDNNFVYHYFYSPVKVNNENRISMITIKEIVTDRSSNPKFYYHDIKEINDIKNKELLHATPQPKLSKVLFEETPFTTNSITQNTKSVKNDTATKQSMQNDKIVYDIDEGIIKRPTKGQRLQLPNSDSKSRVTGARLQLPRSSNSTTKTYGSNSNNIIPPTNNNVKNDKNAITRDYMQNNENNTLKRLTDIEKSLQKFEKAKNIEKLERAKNNIDRETVVNIANILDIKIKGGAVKIENTNMSKLAGKNKTPSIITIDELFKDLTSKNIKEYRKEAESIANNLYRDKIVKIYDTQTNTEINKSGIEKTLSGNITKSKIQSINNLQDIIEQGIYGYTTYNPDDNNGILYHHFFTPVNYQNKNGLIRVVIREFTNDNSLNDKYYYHQLEFISNKKIEGINASLQINGNKEIKFLPSTKNSISQNKQTVKNKTKSKPNKSQTNKVIKSLEDIKIKYKNQTDQLNIFENKDNTISINNLVVKQGLRKQGIGQSILNDIIDYADKNNKTITLTPTNKYLTKNKLTAWYKNNGFVENKGRNGDFSISDTMYRLPKNNTQNIKDNDIRSMKTTKKYNNYTQKELENLNSPKIRIANSEKDVLNFIETAKKIPNNLKLYFGKIDTYIANKIQETLGINVTNYNISLKTDAIRHIMNNHTNSNRENSRGQIPITSDDILNIPDIINNYDNIKKSGTTEQNKDTITFEKNIDGNTVVVTYVSDKHNNLEIQTMYKFKNNKKRNVSPASNVPSTLNPTSETVSSIIPSRDIIPQNGKNVKNDGIRNMKTNHSNQLKNSNNANSTSNKNIRFAKRTAKPKEEVLEPGATNAQRDTNYIEQEIRKIEESEKWDESIPVTKMTDIRKTIENYLGLGIQKGHFRQQAYGIYKGNRDVIRTKELKDIDTILHETGHALDIGKRIKIDKESIANELLKAVNNYGGYETESREIRLEEGFAEVIRMYTIVPEQAKIEYPQTVSVLEGIRKENADFDDFIRKVQEQTYNYIHQRPRNRGGLSNMSIGEQTDKMPLTPESIRQRVIENAWDSNYSIKRAVEVLQEKGNSQELKASENAYLLTRLTSGIGDKITSMLSNGYIDENGNKLFPGLNQLGELLNNDIERFNDLRAYLVAQRDLEYKAKKLKTGIRTMDSKAIVEEFKNDTQIQEASKIIYATLDGVLQYAVNNKLITPNNAKALRESNTFYVPMQRVLGTNGNNVGRKGAVADIIRARTGSELDIKDILENIVTNSANIIQQVENNLVIKALYNQGESVGLTGSIYDEIDPPMKKIGTTNLETWKSELESQGVDIDKIDFDKTIDIFVPNNNIDEKNQIVSFIDNRGQRRYLQFHDEILFKTLTGLDIESTSRVLNFFDKLNKPLRYGATLGNLGFALPNMLSDTVQASIYSEAGFIPIIDTAIGTLDVLASKNKTVRNFMNKVAPQYADKVNMMYYLYEQSGATSATKIGQERKSAQMLMKDIYGTNNSESLGIKENFKPLKRLLDIMTYIPELSEQSTRFRVFEKNLEYYRRNGMKEIDARIQAALQSRDATQDFSRMGKSMREVNKLVPFSAARVGSSYTFLEKIQDNPKRTSMRIAVLMAISMGIKALTSDDDEINELNQRKKDDNFVFKIGDQIITIKKPQGILRSMINLSDYIIDLTSGNIEEGKEGERLAEWLCNAIMDNSIADDVTGLVPSAITPIVENAINKDFYYNTDIVKSYDLELPDSEQYYDYNSQLAIWLGKIFNYSPAKIDNFISGYFAGLGTQVTNIIDWMLSKTEVIPEKPNMGLESNSIGKRFFINTNTNSASVDELYGLKTELTKKKNGNTISDEETQQLESINNAISNMSKLNKQIKEIKKDLTMSGEEKAEKIKILQKQKTDTARSTLGKELLYPENETNNESITFYPSQNTLSQNGYVLNLTSDMKKEYEQLAYNKYKQYENHGLYSKEKLEKLKEKSKDYAKSQLIKKYKNDLIKK